MATKFLVIIPPLPLSVFQLSVTLEAHYDTAKFSVAYLVEIVLY